MSQAPSTLKAFYTIADLMARWGVSRTTIYREIKRGRLKPKRIGGTIRFSADEVARYERVV
jgi:excisionase family DNA binding protein